jgi:hypothetical protein
MRHELPNGRHERRELEAICRALLRELDNDCIWLVWQVVRGHLSQFQIEQLADVDGVRDSNRWLAKDTGTVLKTARERCQRPSDCTSGRLLEKCYDRMVISSPKGQRIVGPAARPWHRVPRFYERALRVLSADTVLNFSAAPRKPGSLDKARNAALRGDLLRVSLGDACSGKHSALNNHTYFVPVSGESSPARRKARCSCLGTVSTVFVISRICESHRTRCAGRHRAARCAWPECRAPTCPSPPLSGRRVAGQ